MQPEGAKVWLDKRADEHIAVRFAISGGASKKIRRISAPGPDLAGMVWNNALANEKGYSPIEIEAKATTKVATDADDDAIFARAQCLWPGIFNLES